MSTLLDLVAASVLLQRRGNRYVGLCPFHNEKTPSFHVFTTKRGHDRFHCFGCGADGERIEWIMRTQRVTDTEARAILKLLPISPRAPRRPPRPELTILTLAKDEQETALKRLHQILWAQTADAIRQTPGDHRWLDKYDCAPP